MLFLGNNFRNLAAAVCIRSRLIIILSFILGVLFSCCCCLPASHRLPDNYILEVLRLFLLTDDFVVSYICRVTAVHAIFSCGLGSSEKQQLCRIKWN